ncbi:ABC transporter substrate-binding protein [Aliiroseovarius sp. KMU-50]|uniref:ABC transporter substrate-binding protein n=1 Tax=Aliiroseovarius salicola TaxID=3009082 RepID=A0ABT4W2C1_9RHOB|nr:ABC transporter substrate-binding protein [Aliiroseovarius sp. KMU-50]MDA5094662.1 ABC transporter substrate-binding protein [Aliiroseovarius sp. KMU-50]
MTDQMANKLKVFLGAFVALMLSTCVSMASELRDVEILYLRIATPERPTYSNLDPIPEDLGLTGAKLALDDNNTTGSFMGYRFVMEAVDLEEGDLDGARQALRSSNAPYVVLDMNAEEIMSLVDGNETQLFFNVRSYDDSLRADGCRASLLHTLPSYSMRADALMQFVLKKRWGEMALVVGNTPEDKNFADALRKSSRKFGMSFATEEQWVLDGDLRRQAGAEVPLLTQKLGDYDVLFVADEHNDFARYLIYNTWRARPVLGGDGLRATGWDRVNEQWGAAQLQSRFQEMAGRNMQDIDYAAWAALRAVDEAQLRTNFASPEDIRGFLLDGVELAGFKGRPLSFRNWNGQMRQPVGLTHASALVAMAPLEGFLHAGNELDSLGVDAPESHCTAFGE